MLRWFKYCSSIAVILTLLTASAPVSNADLVDRWSRTATNTSLDRGDPATITWGFIADGTTISGSEGTSGSDLIAFLDTNIGAGGGGSDLTNRPWFSTFNESFNRWGEVSGLTYIYEPNDDGITLNNFVRRGTLGVRADVRIGGHSIDGQTGQNTLAYNYFPDHGDMVIDTDNVNFYSNSSNNFRGFKNVVMHEAGHGIGLDHRQSNNANFLMEPSINTSFYGPQLDDIWGAQRGYGDVHEKNGGNDVFGNATSLGNVADGATVSIGDDANDAVVAQNDVDFISIDGSGNSDADVDFISFDVSTDGFVDLLLNPMGPTYNRGPQGGNQSAFDFSEQSDLILDLFDVDGTTLLGTSNSGGLGDSEQIMNVRVVAGTYFARIRGTQDAVQFYQFQATFTAVPEPSQILALSVLGLASVGYGRYRRIKRKRSTKE